MYNANTYFLKPLPLPSPFVRHLKMERKAKHVGVRNLTIFGFLGVFAFISPHYICEFVHILYSTSAVNKITFILLPCSTFTDGAL